MTRSALFAFFYSPGIDDTTLTSGAPNVPILKRMADSRGDGLRFAWADESRSRLSGCYKCTKEGCEINMEIATVINCYNIQNTFAMPTNAEIFFWPESVEPGSMWYDYLQIANTASWMKFVLCGFGANHAKILAPLVVIFGPTKIHFSMLTMHSPSY